MDATLNPPFHNPGPSALSAGSAVQLLTLIACNLSAAFYHRDLKPAVRAAHDGLQIARMMLAELHAGLPIHPRAPE